MKKKKDQVRGLERWRNFTPEQWLEKGFIKFQWSISRVQMADQSGLAR